MQGGRAVVGLWYCRDLVVDRAERHAAQAPPAAVAERASAGPPPHTSGAGRTGGELAIEAVGWTLASLTVVYFGFAITGLWELAPLARALGPLIGFFGFASIIGSWVLRGRAAVAQRLGLLALCVVGFALAAYAARQTAATFNFTDELAINQRGAELLLKGINPYTAAIAGRESPFLVPAAFQTSLVGGGIVSHLSYPALSIVAIVPGLLLGLHSAAGADTDVAGWLVTIVLLFALLPGRLRWAAIVIGGFPLYIGLANGSLTDFVFLPFLVLAVWRWDRFDDPEERSPARWMGPIALGLAMSIKQTPWLLLPLLVAAIAMEARGRGAGTPAWRTALRYAGFALGTFALVNIAFFVWSPAAWIRGTFLPLSAATYPQGSGVISLTLFEHVGGVYGYLTYAGAFAYLAVLLAAVAWYGWLKIPLVFLTALVFFWLPRSFETYLVVMIPAALLAAATVRPAKVTVPLRALRAIRAGVGLATAGVVATFALALLAPVPLKLTVLSYASTQKLHAIYRVNVEVENTSSEAVRPTFATLNGEITPITEIWRSDGPALIAPHSHREVALVAPSVAAMPLEHTNWAVVAFTQSPNAISASATQRGEPVLYAALTPSAVPQPVPAGHALSFWVRVFRSNGIPIETGGLLVDLRATGIDSSVPPAALRINGLPSGRTATQRTGAHGLAQFTVVGEPTRETTVLLRASVLRKQGTAEEKGQIVSVTFR